jgi:beta-glucosidase
VYDEGIYVGYRFYDTFGVAPEFPFGFGLTYTGFNIAAESIVIAGDEIVAVARVTNTGEFFGKEVVQLYVAGSKDGRIDVPEQELRGFVKTERLNLGEEEVVRIVVKLTEVAWFDEVLSAWVVLAGVYEARVGNSSRDVRGRHQFAIESEIVVKRCANVLAPKVAIEPLPEIAARIACRK